MAMTLGAPRAFAALVVWAMVAGSALVLAPRTAFASVDLDLATYGSGTRGAAARVEMTARGNVTLALLQLTSTGTRTAELHCSTRCRVRCWCWCWCLRRGAVRGQVARLARAWAKQFVSSVLIVR